MISFTYKSLNKLENRTATFDKPEVITVKTTLRYLDNQGQYHEEEVEKKVLQFKTTELQYQEEVYDGYAEVYEYPEYCTEVPVPTSYYKPVWDGEKWIETITEEELEEMNKPKPQEPTELEKLQDQVEFLADQVADLKLS